MKNVSKSVKNMQYELRKNQNSRMLHFPKIIFFNSHKLAHKIPINPYYNWVLVQILRVTKKTKRVSIWKLFKVGATHEMLRKTQKFNINVS